LLGCVVLAVAGCSRSEPVSTTTVTSAAIEKPLVSFIEPDPLLTRRVEVAIAADPKRSIAAKNVGVSVENGVATLEGTVPDVATLRAVESAVSGVSGVDRVNDRLEVSTLRNRDWSESDDRISFALERSLTTLSAAGNAVDKISIDVEHGIVALRGTTDAAETRAAIEAMTERTPGVVGVIDEIAAP
jgi:osmotically-inducible protein OsmY